MCIRDRADADRAVVLHGHAAQLVQLLDGDEFFSGAAAFADLDEYVGAARDDLRLGMLDAELTGMFYACLLYTSCEGEVPRLCRAGEVDGRPSFACFSHRSSASCTGSSNGSSGTPVQLPCGSVKLGVSTRSTEMCIRDRPEGIV